MAYVRVYNRALSPEEIARLADPARPDSGSPEGCLVRLDFDRREGDHFPNLALPALPARVVGTVATGEAAEGLPGTALKLDGQGFLEIADDRALDCPDGITLAAWIRPAALPPAGVRVIDKSPVGIATAYLLDTYPGNSLRLIARDPFLTYAANLPLGRWSHVAATVEGTTRQRTFYLNASRWPLISRPSLPRPANGATASYYHSTRQRNEHVDNGAASGGGRRRPGRRTVSRLDEVDAPTR